MQYKVYLYQKNIRKIHDIRGFFSAVKFICVILLIGQIKGARGQFFALQF